MKRLAISTYNYLNNRPNWEFDIWPAVRIGKLYGVTHVWITWLFWEINIHTEEQ